MRRFLQKRPAARVLTFLFLAVLLAIPLILLIVNQRREAIATAVWYVIWVGNLLSKAVPQHAYWILFLLAALVIAVASLVRRGSHLADESAGDLDRPGRVHRLTQMVKRAERSPYMKWQLARLLGGLALEKMARRVPASADGRLRRLLEGEGDLSPEVLDYLEAGLDRWPYEDQGFRWRIWRFLRGHTPPGALDLDPDRVVQFLEDQGTRLEVSNDR